MGIFFDKFLIDLIQRLVDALINGELFTVLMVILNDPHNPKNLVG